MWSGFGVQQLANMLVGSGLEARCRNLSPDPVNPRKPAKGEMWEQFANIPSESLPVFLIHSYYFAANLSGSHLKIPAPVLVSHERPCPSVVLRRPNRLAVHYDRYPSLDDWTFFASYFLVSCLLSALNEAIIQYVSLHRLVKHTLFCWFGFFGYNCSPETWAWVNISKCWDLEIVFPAMYYLKCSLFPLPTWHCSTVRKETSLKHKLGIFFLPPLLKPHHRNTPILLTHWFSVFHTHWLAHFASLLHTRDYMVHPFAWSSLSHWERKTSQVELLLPLAVYWVP